MSHYKTLGVEKGASAKDIKKAYRDLAKKYHPDTNDGDEGAESKFKEVTEAYETLSDPNKKMQYDQFGSTSGQQRMAEEFFRQHASGFGQKTMNRRNIPPDIKAPINLSLSESIFGCSRQVKVNRALTCSTCKGAGGEETGESCGTCNGMGQIVMRQGVIHIARECHVCMGTGKIIKVCNKCSGQGFNTKSQKINVNIPPNVTQHKGLRIADAGNLIYTSNGQKYVGNLLLVVNYGYHENNIKRQGNDLYTFVAAPFDRILAEDKIEVEIFKGKRIKIQLQSDKPFAHRYVVSNPFMKGGEIFIEVFPLLPKNNVDSEQRQKLVDLIREIYGESSEVIQTAINGA